MNNQLTFWDHILGATDKTQFGAAIVFALVGIFVSLLLDTTKRDPNSPRTPYRFSWSFLWSDNAKRLLLSIVCTILAVRFSREMFGVDVAMYSALLIGLGADQLIEFIRNLRSKFYTNANKGS